MVRSNLKAGLVLAALLCASSSFSQEGSVSFAVIVNRDNPVDNLSQAELRTIFLGERRFWKGSQRIIVLMRSNGSPERLRTMQFLRMSEMDYRKHWVEKINAGEADDEPAVLPANGTAIAMVSGSVSAIAIIPHAEVKGQVKVVRIDGRLPSDPEYGLR